MRPNPHILMCPPHYYGIEYEINAWMDRERQADPHVAGDQWKKLKTCLVEAGARISELVPVKGLPDMVFTANAALIYKNVAIPSRFRPIQRQPEEAFNCRWFASNGFEIARLPADLYFEGAGDALFCGETLWAGYRMRSDAKAQQQLGKMLGCRVIPLELIDAYFYHLDTCFCPLAPGMAMYFPDAFDDYGKKALSEYVETLIEIHPEEARSFAANAVVVGKTVVTNTGCDRLHNDLREHGFRPVATPLSEFVKAGGSAKCLTLRLDGEEAAIW